jgi:hypothetical protein
MRPGSGDEEDDPEISDDQPGHWYEVVYEAAGGGAQAGGRYYESLESAIEAVSTQTHGSVRWT